MSAVLALLSLPGFIDIKTYIDSEIEKALSSKNYVSIEDYNELKAEVISLKAENTELKASYLDADELLASAMKRITQLEGGLFLHDSDGELIKDDEDKPIISHKIESEVIEDAEKPIFVPSGKIEKGAVELIKHAAIMKPFNGGKFINNPMFHYIRKNVLPIELRPTEKGAREWKKQVLSVVKRIAPDAWTDSKKDGNRGTRLGFPRNFTLSKLNVILT
jgi:hypothetical protein